jgi:hypothetical protein
MLKTLGAFLRWVLEHPFGSMLALSFMVMALVLGIEWLEKWPPSLVWMFRHRRIVALVKQVLCMTAIPGLLMLLFSDFRAKPKRIDPS